MRNVYPVVFVSLAASLCCAQTSPPEMRALEFLVGEWNGEGWFRRPGATHTFEQTESVRFALDGAVLQVEGRGIEAGQADPVHISLGIICFERATNRYMLRAYRGDGQPVDAVVELEQAGLVWTMEVPGGTMRWHITVEGDRWIETGTLLREGAEDIVAMEMTLQRAPAYDQSTPQATVESWLRAVQAVDREAALSLGTADWRAREESWARSFTSAVFEHGLRLQSFTVHEAEIDGDEASLAVTAVFVIDGEEDGEGLRFRLAREEESWRIVELR